MGEADVKSAVQTALGQGLTKEALNRVVSLGARYQVSPDHQVAIIKIMTTAGRDQLPVEPLVEKLEEGLAKNIAPVRIEAALLAKVDDFRFVRGLAQRKSKAYGGSPEPTPTELADLTGTLEMGLSREELTRFIESAPDAPWSMLVIGAENTALLGQIGFDRVLTEKIIQAGLDDRGFSSSWSYLSRAVVAARDRGSTDEAIAKAALDTLKRKGTVRGMMEILGFTGRDLRREPQAGPGDND